VDVFHLAFVKLFALFTNAHASELRGGSLSGRVGGFPAGMCNAAQTCSFDPVRLESLQQETFMNGRHAFVIGTAALSLFGHVASAQDVARYRGYVLESTLESVAGTSGARATDAKTIHERPAKIQELEWRAPYMSSGSALADPVRGIVFTFLDDSLYQVVVSYDRDRTDGLTNSDIIDTLTAEYGPPVLRSAKQQRTLPAAAQSDTIALAQWETVQASLTLVRDAYTPEFQLILLSKPLSLRARNATREAIKLDAAEAPQRELDQRKKEAAAASAAREQTRATNKAAFRP
jgi:hypothetical protein